MVIYTGLFSMIRLAGLGIWLLCRLMFEDTSDWTYAQMKLARQTFAVIILVVFLTAVFFSVRSIASTQQPQPFVNSDLYFDKRLDYLQRRQEKNFEEHEDIYKRLSAVENSAMWSQKQLERIMYGVTGLTFAVLGQLLLQLFKFKVDRDDKGRIGKMQ